MISSFILMGVILRPFGVTGELCVKSFAESEQSFKSYKIFYTDDGCQEFKVKKIRADKKDVFILYFDHITSRTEAEKFKHQKLYVQSSQLKPLTADEYYHHELINLDVFDDNEQKIGVVKKVTNYGSDDLLEIKRDQENQLILIPFNARFIKCVQLSRHRVVVDHTDVNMLVSLNGAAS